MLIQKRLANDLIDEVRPLVYPLAPGRGKRFFGKGTIPAATQLAKSATSPNGVLIASYQRAGEIKTGSFAIETPTAGRSKGGGS